MRWSNAEYMAYQARQGIGQTKPHDDAEPREADLHEKVLAECQRRGWICFHSRMDIPQTGNLGTPDCIILAENSHVFMCELKTKKGKLSTNQTAMAYWANRLGHTIHCIRSFSEFIAIINDPLQPKASN